MNTEQTRRYYESHPRARYVALVVVCLGALLPPLTIGTVVVALPDIARDLRADAVLVSWIPMVLLLASVMALLPAGKLADNYGRKRFYIWGLVIITLAAITASMANSIEWILFWRAVQGVGSAMAFGTGMAILTSVFPPNERGLPLGMLAATVYVGLTAAPLVGGWCTELWGWRSVFLVQVPLAVVLISLITFGLKGEWKADKKAPFDYTGAALFALAAFCFVVAMQGLPALPYIALLVASGLCLFLFVRHADRAKAPLVRLDMFRHSRTFSLSLMSSFLMYSSTYPMGFLMSLYLQYIKGTGPAEAGQIMLVQALVMAVLAPVSGRLSDHFEPRAVATVGCLLFGVGVFILLDLDFSSAITQVSVGLILLGAGFGLFSTANNNAAMSSVNPVELSSGAALVNLARVMGNLSGMGVVMLIVQRTMGKSEISPERYDLLLETVQVCLAVAFCYVLIATLLSALRGRVR